MHGDTHLTLLPRSVSALAICAIAALSTSPAAAQDPLRHLLPLLEVYDARKPSPGYDVAGIRCAGLFVAQDDWAHRHGMRGPSRAELASVEELLTRAEQFRRNAGFDLVAAQESTRTDVMRVVGLYQERFSRNAKAGHPWSGDRLIKGDAQYCDILRSD